VLRIKNLTFFLSVIICVFCRASIKRPLTSPLALIPGDITRKITSYLPKGEQNKMFLVNKALFEQTYFLQKENRIRAFKNYLMYPYLSRFNVLRKNSGPVLFNTDDETDTLSELLQNDDNNKRIFYSLFFKEAHPDYFDIEEWRMFFGLKQEEFEVELGKNQKSYYCYVNVISFDNQEVRSLLSGGDINKVLTIDIDEEIVEAFDPDEVAKAIIDTVQEGSDTIKSSDELRIIFRLSPHPQFGGPEAQRLLGRVVNLGTILFDQGSQKGVHMKIIDITKAQSLYYNAYSEDADADDYDSSFIKGVPVDKYILYITLEDQFMLFKQNHPNIEPKPYYASAKEYLGKGYLGYAMTHEEAGGGERVEKLDKQVLTYLCEKNFGLRLIADMGFERGNVNLRGDFYINFMRILTRYVSPFALLGSGTTFFDVMFLNAFLKEEIEHVVSFARRYGININSYYSPGLSGTFLTYSFIKQDEFPQRRVMWVNKLITEGVDLFLEVNGKTILEHFFSSINELFSELEPGSGYTIIEGILLPKGNKDRLYQKLEEIKIKQFVMFQSLLRHQAGVYSKLTKQGNTILHSYFKYAKCFNKDIINAILDASDLNINTVNQEGETTFECYINFLSRMSDENPFDQKELNEVVTKFVEKGFNFTLQTKSGKSLSALQPVFPNLPWDTIMPLIHRQFKRSRW